MREITIKVAEVKGGFRAKLSIPALPGSVNPPYEDEAICAKYNQLRSRIGMLLDGAEEHAK